MFGLQALAQNSIDDILKSYQADKDLQHAQVSFCIIDAASGKTLKEYNPEMAMIPASTLKIVTTSAALGILGKNYTYKTGFYLTENPDATGTYKGDILIKGSGDPSFNSSYFYSSDSLFLGAFVKKLKAKGIKKITGTVKADISYFDNSIPSTWIWGDIGNYFGAGANGLSYSDNKFSLFYSSAETGSTAKLLRVSPEFFAKTMTIDSDVKAYGTEDDAVVYGGPDSYARKVSGTIPPNQKNYEVEAQAPNPALFFCYSLVNELNKQKLLDHPEDTKPYINEKKEDLTFKPKLLFHTHVSPTLEKIVFYTNTKSNNHYAESLLKTIGATKSGKQGTTSNGIAAVENYWKDRGVDVSGLHMSDGSGLSRNNAVTTKLQATILSKIYRDSLIYNAFNASLPVAGKSGSMTSLCKGTFAENNMRAKTGYINRARGYCGYVKTKSGKELAFSVLFNNYDCSPKEAKLKIEKLLVALTEL